jgi:signal peptide peptidase SppA
MHTLPHLAARILGTPLLIQPQKLDIILSVLGMRIGVASPAVPQALFPAELQNESTNALYQVGRIAVIPVTGSLVNRALALDAASGLTSYGDIRNNLDAALADPNIDGIVFDIDSPGGEAGGAFDLADRIYSARADKPIWAAANDQAFSAAYAIASSCARLFVTRTGGVGSVGVIALHVDQSQKDAQDGYHYTPVYAGQRKNDFSPHAPLSPDAQAALQSEVDRLQNLFVATVARNRGRSEEAIRSTEAGLYFSDNAVTAQLADAIGTLDDAITSMTNYINAQRALTQQTRTNLPAGKRALLADTAASPINLSHTQKENDPMEPTNPTSPDTAPATSRSDATPTASAVNQAASVITATTQAAAIADLCMLAGMPERTADLLKRNVSIDDARRELLAAKASAGEEIHSRVAPSSHSASDTNLEQNPVVKAARARVLSTRTTS